MLYVLRFMQEGGPPSNSRLPFSLGWWVDDSTQHPVWVLNPKRIQVFVTRPAESPLPSKLVNQIVYKLTERCRLRKE